MYQAVNLYLEMLKEDNDVIKFISENKIYQRKIINKIVSIFFQQSDMEIFST